MPYSSQVLDHFEHPRNAGELAGADAEAGLEHPVCGDVMRLAVRVRDGRIEESRFQSHGCVASIAAGSCLTEMIQGMTISEAAQLERKKLVEALGGLENASMHASHLAIDVLNQVLAKLSRPAATQK